MKRLPSLVPLLALVLVPAPVRDVQPPTGSDSPPLNEAIQLEDRRLLRLSGVGRFTEVLEQGRARLRTGPRTCLLAELTAHSAERTGRLPELIEELQDVRRNEPLDNVLLFGQALALRLRQEDWPARNLLALAIRRGVPCHEAYQYFVELSQNQGRLGEADVVLEQLRAARADDPRVLMARAYAWDLRGDVSKALAGYQQAILEAPPLAVTHRYYSRLLATTGQFERAAHSSRTGARLARTLREPQQLAPLLTVQGISLDWMERYEESHGALEQALLVTRENNLFALEARILVELSILSGARGRMDDSLDYLARARALEDHVYLPADRIRYFLRLGNALASLGRSETAMGVLTESLALAEARGDKLMAVEARLQVARQMLASGEIAAAGLFRSSYAQAVVLDDGRGQARALSGLGASYERMGSYTRSLAYYQQALELTNRASDRHAEAIALGNVGLLYFRLNQPSLALLYSANATQVARELKDIRLEASLLNGLAAALAGLGRLEQSEQVYRRALDVASRIASPELEGSILTGWSRVTLAQGNTTDALEGFERARVLARSANNPLISVQALYGLGQSYAREANFELAAEHFEETLRLVESTRDHIPTHAERMSYLETRSEIYASLASALLQREVAHPESGYREEAFQVVERSRARTLLDLLSFSRENDEAASSSRISADAPRTLNPHEVRSQVLKPGEVLLEYTLGEPRSILWVLTRDDFRVVELPGRRDIETLAGAFLRTLRSPPRAPLNPFESHFAPARELFGTLLGPVADLLSAEPHVIIVADGILHHLPFETLATDGPTVRPRYLAEMATVSYVPSASVLGFLRRRRQPTRHPLDFLGVAQSGGTDSLGTTAPELGLADLPLIPHASLEVERVARLFPEPRRRTYLGSDAHEAAVKATDLSRFRILHFAAHAMTDELFPARSAILLGAGSGQEDGLLRMDEILSLNLSSDLVVLSACQTGVGQLLRAEGTLGFTWAFLSAGSSAIVASQWSVNDRSTAEMMEAFYSQMSQGLSPTAALRAAKLGMLDSERAAFRHPYYWAPFVLVGAGS